MVRLTTYPNAQDTPYKDTGRGTPAGLAAAGDSIPHDATRLARESGALPAAWSWSVYPTPRQQTGRRSDNVPGCSDRRRSPWHSYELALAQRRDKRLIMLSLEEALPLRFARSG